jgi:hypothetical protein
MKPAHSFRLTKTNWLTILEYAELTGVTPAEFLNKFLDDFLVGPFNDPANGTREEFLCQFTFKSRAAAKGVIEWLTRAEKENLC